MSLTFLLGGARSGKSSLAIELARRWTGPVTFIATGEPGDDEMAERIRVHRSERPGDWATVEAPLEVREAFDCVAFSHDVHPSASVMSAALAIAVA